MTSSPFGRLRRRLLAVAFVDELSPLYAVYTLWFIDNGLDAGQISTVFVIWASVGIALEVPSGALADLVDRRRLIAAGLVLRATGIAIWLIEPTFTGVVIGAVLWALHMSLASGAWEALVHDELVAIGEEHRYAPVMARVGQAISIGVAVGTGVAAIALAAGASLESLGWVTVAVHAVSIWLVLGLPDVRWVVEQETDDESEAGGLAGWWSTLRDGARTAFSTHLLAGIVLVTAGLEGLFVVDEYVPILARDRGVDDAVVPLLVLGVLIGLVAGGEVAARRPDIAPRPLGFALVLGAAGMMIAVTSSAPAALLLVGVGYGIHEVAWVLGDARLQERIGARHRATVSSVRSLLAGLVATAAFVLIGLLSDGDDPSPGLLVPLVLLAVVGLGVTRFLPRAATSVDRSSIIDP
ncbi:MAG: MFS transporter [Actinomycetota bacterium]